MEKTLGQLYDEGEPICVLFSLIADLCKKRGWMPVGFRRIELPDNFSVAVNGTNESRADDEGMEVPPFHCSASRNGWPLGVFTMFGGVLIGECEDTLIAALEQELKA